jgi:hypothetical protein
MNPHTPAPTGLLGCLAGSLPIALAAALMIVTAHLGNLVNGTERRIGVEA